MGIISRIHPGRWFSTIRTKIAALISILIALISIFIFIFFPARLEKQAIKAISAKAESISEMTAFSIAPALFFEDAENIEAVLKSAQQNEDLAYVVVLDGSGNVMSQYSKEEAKERDFNYLQNNDHISSTDNIYRVITPIFMDGNEIGRLYLGLSLEGLKSEVANSRMIIALVSLIIFIAGVVAVFGISTIITNPLSKMSQTFGRISGGDLTQRAEIFSQDEVGKLAKSFNLMVDNLESAHNKMESINQELEQEVSKRERINEELNSFVFTVSHDLKTPLVTLNGFSAILKQDYGDQLGEDGNMYVERIQKNSEHMGTLIQDLLDLSRVGRIVGKPELVNIKNEISEIADGLSHQLRERGTRFVVKDEMPELWLDRTRIRQVFTNLISNANKFMGDENADPTIEVGYGSQNGYHKFYVKDNGIGIDEEYHDKIFQMFQRLEDIAVEGTGVGLAIVKKIVNFLGGEIWVDSAVGKGATMYFTLPKAVDTSSTESETA